MKDVMGTANKIYQVNAGISQLAWESFDARTRASEYFCVEHHHPAGKGSALETHWRFSGDNLWLGTPQGALWKYSGVGHSRDSLGISEVGSTSGTRRDPGSWNKKSPVLVFSSFSSLYHEGNARERETTPAPINTRTIESWVNNRYGVMHIHGTGKPPNNPHSQEEIELHSATTQ